MSGVSVSLILFGGFEALLPSGHRVKLAARKAQALIAYCALRPGSHLRQALATLLWGESSDDRARNSLRQTLFVLRSGLGEHTSDLLRIEADTIATKPLAFDVDVRAFEQLAAEGTVQALEKAAALYRGDLLEGLVVEAEVFEQWLMQERERLRDIAIEVLAKLFRHHSSSAAPESAIQIARRLLALDPLQEAVHRALMRLLAQSGRREAALQQYDACAALLKRELRLEPDVETAKLREGIASGHLCGAIDPLRFVGDGESNDVRFQATVEAIEPISEELPCAREQHRAMNEELRATKAELRAVTEELSGRTQELAQASLLLDTVLDGLSVAVAIVDGDSTVLAWNRAAEGLWGLRADETRGRSLMGLDVGLPSLGLREAFRNCLDGAGRHELRVEAVDCRGAAIVCLVTLAPVATAGSAGSVIVTMEAEGAAS